MNAQPFKMMTWLLVNQTPTLCCCQMVHRLSLTLCVLKLVFFTALWSTLVWPKSTHAFIIIILNLTDSWCTVFAYQCLNRHVDIIRTKGRKIYNHRGEGGLSCFDLQRRFVSNKNLPGTALNQSLNAVGSIHSHKWSWLLKVEVCKVEVNW